MDRPWLRWCAVALWCLLIYYLSASSLYTGESTRGLLARLLAFLSPGMVDVMNVLVRKAAHVVAFGMLAVWVRWATESARQRDRWAWIGSVAYAAFDEWHQSWVPGRSGSAGDVLLDAAGAALFLAALHWWHPWRRGTAGGGGAVSGNADITRRPALRRAVDPGPRPPENP